MKRKRANKCESRHGARKLHMVNWTQANVRLIFSVDSVVGVHQTRKIMDLRLGSLRVLFS